MWMLFEGTMNLLKADFALLCPRRIKQEVSSKEKFSSFVEIHKD